MSRAVGYIAAGIAVLFFGSNFVPVKQFETGDGVFFQWILCSGIFITGFVVNVIRNFPPFEPLALLGGFLWCSGNMLTVPIVKMIGLSLGLVLWGMANLCMGWSSGHFGLFGLKAQTVKRNGFNIAGLVLAVFSTVLFIFVKPNDDAGKVANQKDDYNGDDIRSSINHHSEILESTSRVDRMNPTTRRIMGVFLALLAGVFYGVNFDPPQWDIDHKEGSGQGIDYVFSHFTGIYLGSTFYMALYCVINKNSPTIYKKVILPGFVSGVMWAIAQVMFFVANTYLSFVISYPIIATGPGVVASLWGVLLFREIQGLKNILCLVVAFIVTIVACSLISYSNL